MIDLLRLQELTNSRRIYIDFEKPSTPFFRVEWESGFYATFFVSAEFIRSANFDYIEYIANGLNKRRDLIEKGELHGFESWIVSNGTQDPKH